MICFVYKTLEMEIYRDTGSMVEYPFALNVHSAFLMKRTIYDGIMRQEAPACRDTVV